MSIEARQIQETLYSYAAILNFTPSPQGLRAKFGACSVQNAQLLRLAENASNMADELFEACSKENSDLLNCQIRKGFVPT